MLRNEMLLKMMVPDLQEKRKTINQVCAVKFYDFLSDVDTLSVALYAGNIRETIWCLQLPENDYRRQAAEKAKELHLNMLGLRKAVSTGCFETILKKLLKIAQTDTVYGAKLAQVFFGFLEYAEEHCLSKKLLTDMETFLRNTGHRDGFLITKEDGDKIYETFVA